MDRNVVVVYGSGASYASGYSVGIRIMGNPDQDVTIRPPMDREFFAAIDTEYIRQRYQALWHFKNLYIPENVTVGLEELWSSVDLNHKHLTLDTYSWKQETEEYLSRYENKYPGCDLSDMAFDLFGRLDTSPGYNKYKFLGDCGRDFRRLIYDVYSQYVRPTNDNYYKILHNILAEKDLQVNGYVTFNYDCYLEDSLSETHMKYIDANTKTDDIQSLTYQSCPIVKLHGSLNWEESYDNKFHKVTYMSPPHQMEAQVEPFYGADPKWRQPAIIPPTIYKQEINDDSRINNHLSRAILQQWRAAITLLSMADIIIIVGYSFPSTDFHAKRIFQISNMIRKRNKKDNLTLIYCCGNKEEENNKQSLMSDLYGGNIVVKTFVGFENVAATLGSMLT